MGKTTKGASKINEIKQHESVSYERLMEEVNSLIEEYKLSDEAVEALESIKWWAMEEIVPTVDE